MIATSAQHLFFLVQNFAKMQKIKKLKNQHFVTIFAFFLKKITNFFKTIKIFTTFGL